MTNKIYNNQEYFIDSKSNLLLPKKAHFCELKDTSDLFSITLICSEEILNIQISFVSVESYRSTDEGSRLEFLNQCPEGILGEKILIKVINSRYIDWFMNESFNIHDKSGLSHYMIITSDNIIDVLTYTKPQILLK